MPSAQHSTYNISAWPSLLDAVARCADARGWAALDDLNGYHAALEIAEALGFVVRERRYGREFVVLTPIGRGLVADQPHGGTIAPAGKVSGPLRSLPRVIPDTESGNSYRGRVVPEGHRPTYRTPSRRRDAGSGR